MDFFRPLQALFPGVQGRVLVALCGTSAAMSGRQVARVASASPSQVAQVLSRLTRLGIVERSDVPPAALYKLNNKNLVTQALLSIHGLHRQLITLMTHLVEALDPPPVNITLFGSMARGTATATSDIDVLVVRPTDVDPNDSSWESGLTRWQQAIEAASGNKVEILEVSVAELHQRVRSGAGVWSAITIDGQHIAGKMLNELVAT